MNYSRICAKVDLDAILYNIHSLSASLKENTLILAVVKADGYGHGAIPIARELEKQEVIRGFAVATAEEALELRDAGIKKMILVLGCVFPESYEKLMLTDVRFTVSSFAMAQGLSAAAADCGRTAYIHIKIDTGMHRIGFPVSEDSADEIERLCRLPGLSPEGIFTHFARADEKDKAYAKKQRLAFDKMIGMLEKRGRTFTIRHCANSAAAMELPEAQYDMVRAGISVYGLWPSEEMDHSFLLRPALSLYSRIVHIKWLPEGSPISYGGTYVTSARQRIATIPVGYGDGYPRALSNRGYVLIHGRRAPIVGRVCMDQFMVDVTHIPEAAEQDRVVLIGSDMEENISMEELGELSGRFNYEFACDLGNRIPRLYYKAGQLSEIKDYFKK